VVHSTRKAKPIVPNGDFKPSQFVNVTLESAQRDTLKAANFGADEFESAFAALCADGYSLKLRYDDRNDCFSAWLLPAAHSKHDGMILSGRGSTPMKAIKQLCFIHFKMLEGDWGANQGISHDPIDD
jgi:hypothetical protein